MRRFVSQIGQSLYRRNVQRATIVFLFVYALTIASNNLQNASLCLLMICFVVLVNRMNIIAYKTSAWLIPFALALIETASALWFGGDKSYFLFLTGCCAVSLTCLDYKDLLFYVVLTNILTVFVVFLMGCNLLGGSATAGDHLVMLAAYNAVSMLLFCASFFHTNRIRYLENSSQTFETIMETTPSYMMTSGEAAAVDFISVSLANWLGIPDRDLVRGRPLLDLFMGEMKTMFQEVMEESGYVEKNFEVNIGDKTFWFVLRSSIMDNDKRSRFFEWWDVTPIIEAKNEAVAAARAKSDFLANVSHEIRTPMNAILGMTELMMMNSLEPEQIERASAIKIASMSLLEIVNDILDFSKIDARKMEIIIKPFDFPSFINDTVNLVNIKASGAGLAFTTNIAHDIPPLVNGDELRLKQSLLNILNNAVKFTKSGSISLRVWREPLVNGAMKLNFSVKDTGIGIKSEDIGKLFGVFQQLDTRKNRQIMGTGLGLAITKSLVEMMGGAVTAESVYGKGTTFSFYVLCEGPHRGSLAVIPDPGILRVLCYEPNIYNARAFREMLDDLAVPRDVCIDIAEASKFLNKNIYTHVFFDSSAKAVVTGFRYKQGTRFIQLKEVTDKNEGDFDGFINRPVLVTTLANTLTGQETATSRLHSDDTKTGSFQTSGVRILVVDDNPVNLLVAKGLLREYGIDVETAASGQDAIAMVKETEYDIIFMDHMMPGMDGLDATKAIRALGGRHQNGIIIALTANAVADAQKLFRQAGMDDFLSKPIIISNLRQMLLRHLPKEKIL